MNIYILAFLLFLTVSSSVPSDNHQESKSEKGGTAAPVYKSTDGSQTWQDISKGLPENLRVDTVRGKSIFANDNGLFLRVGNQLYNSKPGATAPFWTKEVSPDEYSSITGGNSEVFAKYSWGVNLEKTNGTSVWSPVFDNSHEPRIREVFETARGAIFLGTDKGIFKTVNNGKDWKQVYVGGFVGHLAESNGVLVATGMKRIIRSTDNGENWAQVSSDDTVAFDVKPIPGGFAAITSRSESDTRRLSRSYDGGKTWKLIGAGVENKVLNDSIGRTWNDRPRLKAFMTPVIQVGEDLVCTHPKGIFRSSDKGKTWKFSLPAIKDKVFSIFVSGKVIYAVPSKGGC